jgi:hypothetical protein
MYTTVLLIALAGFSVPTAVVETPSWLTDYSMARQRGKEERKPLAIFIGSGRSGWEQVSRAGKLSHEAQRILASHYVCVYVDITQQTGTRLATAFEIPDGLGIVLSDFTGEVQAFRHEGNLAEQDLSRSLRRYTDPERSVRTTESGSVRQVSYYPPESSTLSRQPPTMGQMAHPSYFGGGRSC